MLAVIPCLEQRDSITKDDRGEYGMSEALEIKFLEKSTCYICGENIYNYELNELFDGRIVKSCFECYITLEIGKMKYYCDIGTTENYIVDYCQMSTDSDEQFMLSMEVLL